MAAPLLPPLDCGGCTKCCQNESIALLPQDNAAQFKTRRVGGEIQLATRPDGQCFYLMTGGCRLQGRTKPTMCAAFDCRVYAWNVLHASPEDQVGRIQRASVREGIARLQQLGLVPAREVA